MLSNGKIKGFLPCKSTMQTTKSACIFMRQGTQLSVPQLGQEKHTLPVHEDLRRARLLKGNMPD